MKIFSKRKFSIILVVSLVNIGFNVLFINGEALYDFSCFHYAIAHTITPSVLILIGGTSGLENSHFIISNCRFSGRSTFPDNGLICRFGDRQILLSTVSFFEFLNLHIQVGRFRGCWGIGDKNGSTVKWAKYHNIL